MIEAKPKPALCPSWHSILTSPSPTGAEIINIPFAFPGFCKAVPLIKSIRCTFLESADLDGQSLFVRLGNQPLQHQSAKATVLKNGKHI